MKNGPVDTLPPTAGSASNGNAAACPLPQPPHADYLAAMPLAQAEVQARCPGTTATARSRRRGM
jgi:hypothetical protein